MNQELRKTLEKGIFSVMPEADEMLLSRLSRLYDEIELFNPTYKLVAAKGQEIVTRHILDCLAPQRIIRDILGDGEHAVADLGSGSGLPGIVLASALVGYRFNLVERMGRRAGFLRNTIASCRLSETVQVVEKDLSEVQGPYDAVVFRAFRPLEDIISDLDRITKPGGYVFAYKSSEENIKQEIEVARSYRKTDFSISVIPYEVPDLDAERSLLVLRKEG